MTTATVDTSVSPLLDAREILANAITAATGYPVYASYTDGPVTPCYILTGGGLVFTNKGLCIYQIKVTCLKADQSGDLSDAVEELARLAAVACVDSGFRILEVPEPGGVTIGTREYAGIQFDATIPVTLRSI